MVYLPAGSPDMVFSLPMVSADIGAASLIGMTRHLLLREGVDDGTAQTGQIAESGSPASGPIVGMPNVAATDGRVCGRSSRGPGRRPGRADRAHHREPRAGGRGC